VARRRTDRPGHDPAGCATAVAHLVCGVPRTSLPARACPRCSMASMARGVGGERGGSAQARELTWLILCNATVWCIYPSVLEECELRVELSTLRWLTASVDRATLGTKERKQCPSIFGTVPMLTSSKISSPLKELRLLSGRLGANGVNRQIRWLVGAEHADVVVIGAGPAGLTTGAQAVMFVFIRFDSALSTQRLHGILSGHGHLQFG
jgi:hypothetical protein